MKKPARQTLTGWIGICGYLDWSRWRRFAQPSSSLMMVSCIRRGGVGTREVFAQHLAGNADAVILRLFLLHHNLQHGIVVQLAGLRELFHPLCLWQWGRGLFAVDGIHQQALLILRERGDLIGRGEGDFLIVHHLHQLRHKVGQSHVVTDGIAAHAHLSADFIIAAQLRRNFRRS